MLHAGVSNHPLHEC